jgi:hypothetical protein
LARPSFIAALLLAALPLGCGEHVERALVDPAKYELYGCLPLAKALKDRRDHAQELKVLYDKAARDSTGTFVANIAYQPDYLSAIGDIELIQAEQRNKNCDQSTDTSTPADESTPAR